jgi:UrcA family protein
MNTIFTMRRAAFGVALLCSGLAAAGALVSPQGRDIATRIVVDYGDLDLAEPAAAETLYRRIASAARRACDEPRPGNLLQLRRYQACYQIAVTQAVDKVNAQTLTALHRAKTQRSTLG